MNTENKKPATNSVISIALLDEIELDALIFQIIRSHQEKSKKQIMGIIKERVPTPQHSQITDSLMRLI